MSAFPDGRPAAEQPRWRQDFPIDWPQDQYVSRRDFLRFLVVVSCGFSVGQLWIGWKGHQSDTSGFPRKKVEGASTLGVGQSLLFTYPNESERCLLVRREENRYVAFSQKCTHLSCAVVPESQANRFHCPCHAGYFDMETGQPLAGPPRRPLPRIELELVGRDVYAVGIQLGKHT